MLLLLLIGGLCSSALAETNSTLTGKALSVFNVVRFPNDNCAAGSNLNGTCYSTSECANRNGVSSGTCANGYGVCCVFTMSCGGVSNENNTYFQSNGNTPTAGGYCSLKICKINTDICSLRLDFTTFTISGPSTPATSNIQAANGNQNLFGGGRVSLQTRCLVDTFSVTTAGTSTPVICGVNTGYHMYVPASDACNNLVFQLGNTANGAKIASREWNIKVSQISCMSETLPPPGCTQYFTGTSGTLNSFNYAAPTGSQVQLANQKQTMCMRREKGYCTICYSATKATDFAISGTTLALLSNIDCCQYGPNVVTNNYDCLVIPGAFKNTVNKQIWPDQYCGANGFPLSGGGAQTTTICTKQQPFMVQFFTDSYTGGVVDANNVFQPFNTKGFKIAYWEQTC